MLDELYSRPGFLLRRAYQLSVAIFENACVSVQLTPSQYAVLVVLHDFPLCSQNRLSLALGMSKVTISQTVKALDERRLITRNAKAHDKRHKALLITAEGERLLKESRHFTDIAYQQFMAPLNRQEQAILIALLRKLNLSLEDHAKSHWQALQACIEPVVPAQVKPRLHESQLTSSSSAPDVAANGCRSHPNRH